jgi:flagellin
MPVVVNTNATATTASFNLTAANDALRHSLAKLSSGKRIITPADDAGGMAVAYKMSSKLKRTEAVMQNVQNSISYLQVQDGSLKTIGRILDRMGELRMFAEDVTKNDSDKENYSKEFIELQKQLQQIGTEQFNGISLFSNDTTAGGVGGTKALTLLTTASGVESEGSISLNQANLQTVLDAGGGFGVNLGNINDANAAANTTWPTDGTMVLDGDNFIASISDITVSMFTVVIEQIADARAENGAEMSRVQTVADLLASKMANLEAAHGRIMDADIALESTRYARQNILVQASAAMTAQANQLTNIAMVLMS